MNALATSFAPDRFLDLGVPPQLSQALEQEGITVPFPIQAAALPDALAGRDVCGKAPTGAGKTLAFGLAILTRLAESSRAPRRGPRHPSALVLVPTRELAAQVEEVIAPLAVTVGARVASFYGGVGYGKQLSALRRGVDVLVACPGRLTDLLERGSVDLSSVNMVVIDEADRMADMGFLPAVRRLVDRTEKSRQTLLFSATLDGPVDKLIRDYQHDPVRHHVEPTQADSGEVTHHFWRVDGDDRVAFTAQAVKVRKPAVVFCRTKRGAERLSDRLGRLGLLSAAIHGDRSQSQRERALAAFRAGRIDVLVATDVAARGIHVDDVPLVIHFDPPADEVDYVHRSGRTGRAGADGTVVSLIGSGHVGTTKQMQRKLGLPSRVTPPSISALGVEVPTPRNARPPQKVSGPGARTDRSPVASRNQRRTSAPARRRRRRPN